MGAEIDKFRGGGPEDQALVNHLNQVVEVVNNLSIRGDEKYIVVRSTINGTTVTLNAQRLLADMPKFQIDPGFLAQIDGNDGTVGAYKYSWHEVTGAKATARTPAPPGYTGTTYKNYATNTSEIKGQYVGPVPTGTVVWLNVSFDETLPLTKVFAFDYMDLIAGLYCDNGMGTTIYGDTLNVGALSFNQDFFTAATAAIKNNLGHREQIDWNGFTIYSQYTGLGGLPSSICHVKQLELYSDSGVPTSGTPTLVSYAGDATGWQQYGVILYANSSSQIDHCSTFCNQTSLETTGQLHASILINPCDFLPFIKDHTGTPNLQYSTVQFDQYFTVTGSTGCNGTGTVSFKGVEWHACDDTLVIFAPHVVVGYGLTATNLGGGSVQLDQNVSLISSDSSVDITGPTETGTCELEWDLSVDFPNTDWWDCAGLVASNPSVIQFNTGLSAVLSGSTLIVSPNLTFSPASSGTLSITPSSSGCATTYTFDTAGSSEISTEYGQVTFDSGTGVLAQQTRDRTITNGVVTSLGSWTPTTILTAEPC